MLQAKHVFAIAMLAAVLLFSAPATAAVLITAGSTNALPGDVGDAIDILLTNTGPSPINVAAFNFEIKVTNVAITFTDATTATVADPYIFAGHSLFGPDIVTSSPGQTLDASDFYDISGGNATVGAGVTVGLGHVLFNVSSGAPAPQTVTVSFNQNNAVTSLSDANGNPISLNSDSFHSGLITIQSPVPEPSASIPLLAGLALIWSRRRYRAY